MTTLPLYIVAYLIGTATPLLVFRALLGEQAEQGDGCLIDGMLAGIGLLILVALFFWWQLMLAP